MKKIGIMGGTFNPIHNGHLMLAEEALEQFALDEVLFMPCGVPYMKADQKVESGQIRAEMTALAIKDYPRFTLSFLELEQAGNTYTYQTLERLKADNPDAAYYFIMGADSLFHIKQWVHPERIFTNCCILAAVRDDKTTAEMEAMISCLHREYNADVRLLQTEHLDISSSAIRRKTAEGESIAEDVPESVRIYIERKGLYT
ncbi:MAG: nicotinate-nucleotide adenylyltransferase [Lachnospiraceae bacterium]|nr:nicotinate-nucleotide adenylyltransferase [Lachnospiraceae bacterium]